MGDLTASPARVSARRQHPRPPSRGLDPAPPVGCRATRVMEAPSVSVVIITGNQPARAARALASVLDQDGIERAQLLLLDATSNHGSPPLPRSDEAPCRTQPLPERGTSGALRAEGARLAARRSSPTWRSTRWRCRPGRRGRRGAPFGGVRGRQRRDPRSQPGSGHQRRRRGDENHPSLAAAAAPPRSDSTPSSAMTPPIDARTCSTSETCSRTT